MKKIFWSLIFLSFPTFAQFESTSFSLGFRTSYSLELKEEENSLMYYELEYAKEDLNETYTLKKNLSFRIFDFTDSKEKTLIDPYDISLEWLKGDFSFQIGFVRYRFSESFGIQLLDVANPRDYSEFIFNDLAWSKRSVFGLNTSYKLYDVLTQFFLTLWPSGDRLAYKDSYYDTSGVNSYEGGVYDKAWFKNIEYGMRFSKIFDNSLSLSFLYYHHEHRPLSLTPKFSSSGMKLVPEEHMVDSFGSSFSYIINDYVLRGDLLFTHNDLVYFKNERKEKDHLQSLVGIDRIFDYFNLGLQSFKDYHFEKHFFGAKFEWTQNVLFTPSVQFFQNTESYDRWIQLKAQMNLTHLTFSISYDDIDSSGSSKTLFGPYKNNDRYLIDIAFRY